MAESIFSIPAMTSMTVTDSPEAVVQRQLDAYNARDLDALLATYAPDARQYELPAQLLAAGHAEMRPRFALRFGEPDLHARLLQRAVMGNIRQNLFFAFAYNAAGVPIAAGVLYPTFGLLLSPIIAAAAMSLSSVSVIGNALRLRSARLG